MDTYLAGAEIVRRFKACGRFVGQHKLRTCFHPDQFVVLTSSTRGTFRHAGVASRSPWRVEAKAKELAVLQLRTELKGEAPATT